MEVETYDQPLCTICRDLEIECDFITRCGHNFHISCLDEVVDVLHCPLCRQIITHTDWIEKVLLNTRKMDADTIQRLYLCMQCLTRVETARTYVVPFDKIIIGELVKAGWDINSPENGAVNFFENICERDDIYRLNLLIHFGFNFTDNPALLNRALEIARERHSVLIQKAIEELMFNYCNDDNGNSPLHIAVSSNDLELVKDLIAKGSDVNARNYFGSRPLHLAAVNANLNIINYLIDNGAVIGARDLNGHSALHEACITTDSNSPAVIKRLIDVGGASDIFNFGNENNTLLHSVLMSKNSDAAIILVDSCADINQTNFNKETYLHLAASFAQKPLLAKLIEAGANLNLKDSIGQTALHKALMKNSAEAVEFLLEKGADVNVPNNESDYPIHLALKRIPCLPFVKALVRYGADLSVKNQNGLNFFELTLEPRY